MSTTAAHPTHPTTVIYIEDAPLHAELLRAGLAFYRIGVIHLAQSDEALIEELTDSRYDMAGVIILDVQLGELTGLQIARRLRANGDSRPIIIVSAHDRPSNAALMAIQAVFIPKPFNFEQISDSIFKLTAQGDLE